MSKEKKKIIIGVILVISVLLLYKVRLLSVGIVPSAPAPVPTVAPTIHIVQPGEGTVPSETYVNLAKKDLSVKLKVNPEEIKTVDIQVVNWNDTSLGCPQKDIVYSQVITEGYKITLKADGKTYKYNAGLNKVVSCF